MKYVGQIGNTSEVALLRKNFATLCSFSTAEFLKKIVETRQVVVLVQRSHQKPVLFVT